ncbi:MAG TPA: OpcA/G6PD domain-containing protein [Candidatus Cybelea sp.]|nr:OpcA/G6PD domain-containing protein [Candidatus Cybelea sp.]
MSLDIASVQDQLARSYRERGCDANVATMTIVVFFDNPAIGELARERIHRLSSKHPSRVIVLDATAPDSVHRVDGCDWIELGAREIGPEMLRAAVAALRVTEAPVVLLWIAPGIGTDPRFESLCEDAQTIVYNSSLLDSGHGALRELVCYLDERRDLPIADIAYLRLAPWQECVAIFFDGDAVGELADLERVEIACGSEPEALYLLGWLASRLQWTPSAPEVLVNPQGKEIVFSIDRQGEPRRIARVALSSSHSTFVAEADASQETILLSVSGSREHGPRYRAIENPGIAALVERAILWGHNDRLFAASLAAAGKIIARGEG